MSYINCFIFYTNRANNVTKFNIKSGNNNPRSLINSWAFLTALMSLSIFISNPTLENFTQKREEKKPIIYQRLWRSPIWTTFWCSVILHDYGIQLPHICSSEFTIQLLFAELWQTHHDYRHNLPTPRPIVLKTFFFLTLIFYKENFTVGDVVSLPPIGWNIHLLLDQDLTVENSEWIPN